VERIRPEVETKAVRLFGEKVWELRIICPLCGKKHVHGGGHAENAPDINFYGHRVSHCTTRIENDAGYILIPSSESPIDMNKTKRKS